MCVQNFPDYTKQQKRLLRNEDFIFNFLFFVSDFHHVISPVNLWSAEVDLTDGEVRNQPREDSIYSDWDHNPTVD